VVVLLSFKIKQFRAEVPTYDPAASVHMASNLKLGTFLGCGKSGRTPQATHSVLRLR